MNTEQEVIATLGQVLNLGVRANKFTLETKLLGELPEFDSMAVITVITSLEERFGIVVEDDELDAEVFEDIASIVRFIDAKLIDS